MLSDIYLFLLSSGASKLIDINLLENKVTTELIVSSTPSYNSHENLSVQNLKNKYNWLELNAVSFKTTNQMAQLITTLFKYCTI